MHIALRARLRAVLGAGVPVDWGLSDPGAALPRVVLTQISGQAEYVLTGPVTVAEARVQVDCAGATFAAARGLAQAVRAGLSGWTGGEISGVWVVGDRTLPGGGTASGQAVQVQSIDLRVIYQEAE